MVSRTHLAALAPFVALVPACGGGFKIGPKAMAARGDAIVQAEGTVSFGYTNGSPQTFVGVPLSLSVGSRSSDGAAIVQLESGLEVARAFGPSRWGFRASGRLGGTPSGPGSAYASLRGGPMFAFSERSPNTQFVTSMSLEGVFSMPTEGEYAGYPMAGAALLFAGDSFTVFRLRIPAGRPLRNADTTPVAAPVRSGRAWHHAIAPSLEGLAPAERSKLGNAWLADARMEHASIATFAALALQLLELGAPSGLIEGVHRALADETRHARLCFGLATAYLGQPVEPGPLPLPPSLGLNATVEELARQSLVDGVLGEGFAAAILRLRARASSDSVARRVISSIAREEARHAALAWQIIEWCVERGGDAVRASLATHWRLTCGSMPTRSQTRQTREAHFSATFEDYAAVRAPADPYGLVDPAAVARAFRLTHQRAASRLRKLVEFAHASKVRTPQTRDAHVFESHVS